MRVGGRANRNSFWARASLMTLASTPVRILSLIRSENKTERAGGVVGSPPSMDECSKLLAACRSSAARDLGDATVPWARPGGPTSRRASITTLQLPPLASMVIGAARQRRRLLRKTVRCVLRTQLDRVAVRCADISVTPHPEMAPAGGERRHTGDDIHGGNGARRL